MDGHPVRKQHHPQIPALGFRNTGPQAYSTVLLNLPVLREPDRPENPVIFDPGAVRTGSSGGEVSSRLHYRVLTSRRVAGVQTGDAQRLTHQVIIDHDLGAHDAYPNRY